MIADKTLYEVEGQEGQLVTRLLSLPQKILSHHDVDGLEQLVLHELGHDYHFALDKAGYFIDNPDFNCLKGIAGYCKLECDSHQADMWRDPRGFVDAMRTSDYHNQLSHFLDNSLSYNHDETQQVDLLHVLGKKLGMTAPNFLTWKMKHGNHGILLYQETPGYTNLRRDLLHHFVPLLSLC